MNKEKLIQLRQKVNSLFFKKKSQSGILAEMNMYQENLL